MQRRRRIKQTVSLHDRLADWAKTARELAAELPPGPERNTLLTKARRADTASHWDEWIKSPSLQPPK